MMSVGDHLVKEDAPVHAATIDAMAKLRRKRAEFEAEIAKLDAEMDILRMGGAGVGEILPTLEGEQMTMTQQEAANHFPMDTKTLRKYVEQGDIPAGIKVGRKVLYDAAGIRKAKIDMERTGVWPPQ